MEAVPTPTNKQQPPFNTAQSLQILQAKAQE